MPLARGLRAVEGALLRSCLKNEGQFRSFDEGLELQEFGLCKPRPGWDTLVRGNGEREGLVVNPKTTQNSLN